MSVPEFIPNDDKAKEIQASVSKDEKKESGEEKKEEEQMMISTAGATDAYDTEGLMKRFKKQLDIMK